MAKKALGRGLEALIPKKEGKPSAGVLSLPVSKIRPNPLQPRVNFHPKELEELVESVRSRGVLQPVLVRKKGDGWELIAGERRWRAAQKLGLLSLPAVEIHADDAQALELALVENLQRSDLSILEEARGYERLQKEFHWTQEQIAQRVGKDRATVANALRLLKLPAPVLQLLEEGKITAGHAKVLAGLSEPALQVRIAERIAKEGWNVRETEKKAGMLLESSGSSKTEKRKDPNTLQLEKELSSWLQTQVHLKNDGRGKGVLKIHYYTLDDLDRILEKFRKGGLR